ncbi:MAG: aminoacyl--tRNA ligase-related protein [bacterium]|nr:aminoacyl--tRNA ligase-related protein [bacterium]
MLFSKIFLKTKKNLPSDESSKNAQLLERGGFIYKNSSGIYTLLPLGWLVIQKIINIVREEINKIDGQEILMPSLISKKIWEQSKRWNIEIGYEVRGKKDLEPEYILGWTHEEVLTELVKHFINSYKDLPLALYQIQNKFRNEPRAKSGLLRGKEFIMKDLYSFHSSEKDLLKYYNKVAKAYQKIFKRCNLKTIYTLAGGGTFTMAYTHEFQVICNAGEDEIFICKSCKYAENKEISKLTENKKCSRCGGEIKKERAIEVGNIFPLGTKYSKNFNLKYKDKNGNEHYVIMGSYGIGITRLMGTIVEIHNDKFGIIWPEEIAPYQVYLINIKNKEAKKLYNYLQNKNVNVLYDDRKIGIGEKFTDADLIGIPYRIVLSPKIKNLIEVKIRKNNQIKKLKREGVIKLILNKNESF